METTDVDEEDFDLVDQEDGSVLVMDKKPAKRQVESTDFGENLAETLDEMDLTDLGIEICELVDGDKESKKKRDEQYAEGIKRTGMGKEAPGGADFEGASRAVHPMISKGCVDFASRAIKELHPAAGVCKTQIIGEADDYKVDKADRKKTYMNWQLATQVSEHRSELEQLLSQLPLGGSQYKRWWHDDELKRHRTETVYVDNVFLPYGQSDFRTASRVTHRQFVKAHEYESRIKTGLYRDLDLIPSPFAEQSASQKSTDKISGEEEDTAYNDEGLREIYMIYLDIEVTGDQYADGKAPYIMHVEADGNRILGLYRNWAETDEQRAKKHWMVEYKFIPWRGPFAVGLIHLVGGLSSAATGGLRALLDSAHFQNFPGAVKLKGSSRSAGETVSVNPTEITELDAPANVTDIRQVVMPFPFPGPSPVLFNLLEWLTQQAEGMIATASEKIADAGANMPVGTALALIEHGSINFSAIHSRCHASLKQELEILHRLNAEHMTDQETVEELGELVVSREDFQGPMDIIPVSDPNIFSEAQRYAQFQAVMQLAAEPSLAPYFKRDRLLKRGLRLLQINEAEDIANLPKDPKRLGALDENYVVASPEPSPIKVFQEQDDIAHLETHLHFLTSPMFGANPLIGPIVYGPMMPHLKDHMMAFYKKHSAAAASALMATVQAMGQQITQAQAEAKGAAFADQVMSNLLGPMVMPALEQAQKFAMQFAPKPPVSPDLQAQLQSAQAIEQMRIAAKKEELAAVTPEAEKERQLKITLKDADLAAQKARDDADREQNDRATVMATALEKQAQELAAQTTQFNADTKAQSDRINIAADAMAQQRKEEAEVQMTLLQDFLTRQVQAIAPPQMDLTPLVQAMQANTERIMQEFGAGMSKLHESHKAPRIARYLKDAMGNKIGVESVVKE